jgi:hypothetical protein
MTRAEKMAVKNIRRLIAETEKNAPHLVNFVVTLADLRAVLHLAERAEELEAALSNIAHLSRACGVDDAIAEARASLAPRTKRRKGARHG